MDFVKMLMVELKFHKVLVMQKQLIMNLKTL